MPAAVSSSNLEPLVIPSDAVLVPDWAREAIRRLNLLTGAKVAINNQLGGYGSGAFSFADGNAVLLLPLSNLNGQYDLAKITSGGASGQITIVNGIVTGLTAPT